MFKNVTRLLGGDPVRRQLDRYSDIVARINALEPDMRALSDEALQARTEELRARLAAGETPDDLLPEAFAAVREASVRTIGLRHFDVQLIGGIVLHEGKIAEMRTGEGKTLVATLPLYLNALAGEGVHLVTVNDYLARRDARWMGPIFHRLGLSVGVLQEAGRTENGRKAFLYDPERESSQEDVHELRIVERKLAYAADITYGTNNEFGFDYLRDNMAQSLEARSQRGHHYAIVDEVDNILIDEARTPLIISGPSQEDPALYEQMARVVRQLRAEDYEISERDRTVALTEIGEEHAEEVLGQPLRDPERPEDITPEQARLIGHLEQALRAEHLFKRNKNYVVQGGRVIIVDEFTGRLMAGRRWSDGLHQAVEAKEGVKVRQDNVTYATITLQNYFRMYGKLAGMTGTALTEAEEFNKIYKVDVIPLPTNLEWIAMQPDSDLREVEAKEDGARYTYFARKDDPEARPAFWRRRDLADVVFRTEEAKLRAVVREILMRHVSGQPLLVGTTSVEMSERLSNRLRAEMLQRLALTLVLRDAYLEAHKKVEEGMRVEELQPLYTPLEELTQAALRPFARDLDVALNPTRPENLERLIRLLELDPERAETLARVLEGGIRHAVLNAKKHDEESRIIAGAGALGAVTIATNMAGRGVDIKLGGEIAEEVLAAVNRVLRRGMADPELLNMDERLEALDRIDREAVGIYEGELQLFRQFMQDQVRVIDVGGLHVIGSERHESRRIDNQLRGRAARQGDPGSSQFFLSLGDELMRLFGGYQVSSLMERLNIDDAMPIAHGIVNKTIEQAQSRVEGNNFDTRKHLLEYDDVLNKQREVFYGQRNRVFLKDDLTEDVRAMKQAETEKHVAALRTDDDAPWKLLAWLEETQPTLGMEGPQPYPSFMLRLLLDSVAHLDDRQALTPALLDIAQAALETQYEHVRAWVGQQFERSIERLDEQVRQRTDLAETALEGARMEAEQAGQEPDPRALISAVEQVAGVRVQVDDNALQQIRSDPERFRKLVPQLVEASLGGRVWAGMVMAVERRTGESLGLEPGLPAPIDWRAAEQRLFERLEDTWQQRRALVLGEIERELDQALADLPDGVRVPDAVRTRLLIQMSYGQRTFFDKRTHQRRSFVVARLAYPYYAAQFLPQDDPAGLTQRILDHLEGAQHIVQQSFGSAEFQKQADRAFSDLDPRLQRMLKDILPAEVIEEVQAAPALSALPAQARASVIDGLGNLILSLAYRSLILGVGDRLWVDYLTQMEALRTSIGLEAYGQRDPLVQYKSRAFDMFTQLVADIRAGVVARLFRSQPAAPAQPAPAPRPEAEVPAAPVSRPEGTELAPPDDGGKKRRRRRR
jgi:preprotein translocase subunit SecA